MTDSRLGGRRSRSPGWNDDGMDGRGTLGVAVRWRRGRGLSCASALAVHTTVRPETSNPV
ncbi:hypothetical protein BRC90_03290 [Halobacteriales archaeon QS_4_69_34]|nr:MAG: hypothetical protein BRC90_03290 [Halobacteriales archaeon QS_4_69_34]